MKATQPQKDLEALADLRARIAAGPRTRPEDALAIVAQVAQEAYDEACAVVATLRAAREEQELHLSDLWMQDYPTYQEGSVEWLRLRLRCCDISDLAATEFLEWSREHTGGAFIGRASEKHGLPAVALLFRPPAALTDHIVSNIEKVVRAYAPLDPTDHGDCEHPPGDPILLGIVGEEGAPDGAPALAFFRDGRARVEAEDDEIGTAAAPLSDILAYLCRRYPRH